MDTKPYIVVMITKNQIEELIVAIDERVEKIDKFYDENSSVTLGRLLSVKQELKDKIK